MAKVISVCSSASKGTSKSPVKCGVFKVGFGLVGDAHAGGESHREISLLAIESIQKMNADGFNFKPGDFAENLTTIGISLISLPIGTNLKIGGEVILQVTQIGKKCHTKCAIYQDVGKCIMPKEGVFARIIQGGNVRAEDEISIL
jgi:molybdopterin adenylyltransferase